MKSAVELAQSDGTGRRLLDSSNASSLPVSLSEVVGEGNRVTALSAVRLRPGAALTLETAVFLIGDNRGRVHVAFPNAGKAGSEGPVTHSVLSSVQAQGASVNLIASTDHDERCPGVETDPHVLATSSAPYATVFQLSMATAVTQRPPLPAAGEGQSGKKDKWRFSKRARTAAATAGQHPACRGKVRQLEGHALPVSDAAFVHAPMLHAVTASLDGTVRFFDVKTSRCTRVIELPQSSPALRIAFDTAAMQRDMFVVGSVGKAFAVDLAPASRPGFSQHTTDVGAPQKGAAGGSFYRPQQPSVVELAGLEDEAQQDWLFNVAWNCRTNTVTAVGSTRANAEGWTTRNVRQAWHPVAPLVVPEASDASSEVQPGHQSVVHVVGGEPSFVAARDVTVWPPESVTMDQPEPENDEDAAAAAVVEAGAEGEADEFADDEEVAALVAEREELRAMCAELMQRRKALRAELRVTA